jgi:hypothetical protein
MAAGLPGGVMTVTTAVFLRHFKRIEVRPLPYIKPKQRFAIRCRKKNSSWDVSLLGFCEESCLIIVPEGCSLRLCVGDEIEIDLPCGNEGLKIYKGKVGKVRGRRGEICTVNQLVCLDQMERRGAERFPANIGAEFCYFQDKDTGEFLHQGFIRDVSKTGVCLATGETLEMGRTLVLMFEINWDDIQVPVGVMGTVVREQTTPDGNLPGLGFRYGIKFNSPRMVM